MSRHILQQFALVGLVASAHLGVCLPCRADFSSANFKRVWAEEFGPGVLPTAKPQAAAAPHPAVARIVVPEGAATSFGSGTLVDVRDDFGIVVTNWHVVRDAQGPIEVIFPGGYTSKARSLKLDADWDLAALVVWRPPVEPVKIASTAPQPGDQLTICGYGPGIYRSVTGFCTQYYAPRENFPQQMVELNVEARQGDSGGPIFNSRGELAGVLFGAGNGTTLGSYGGRVDQFLASLAPDIGCCRIDQVAESQQTSSQIADRPNEFAADGWHSSTPTTADSAVEVVSNTLLEPPAFDELNQVEVEHATPLHAEAESKTVARANHVAHVTLFEQIKTGLAAFGLFSMAVMLLKAAG